MGVWTFTHDKPASDVRATFVSEDEAKTRWGSNMRAYWMVESYAGRVFSEGESNGYDDSDFYAVVWDEKRNCIERHVFGTTRGWSYPNGCVVDALPEVLAAREACEKLTREVESYNATKRVFESPTEKGKRVKVIKGRKVAKGTTGEVVYAGRDKFSRTTKYRLGIKDDAGEVHYTSADNCIAITGDDAERDLELCADDAFQAYLAALWATAAARVALEEFDAKRLQDIIRENSMLETMKADLE